MGNQLANGLKTVGAKAASALPGSYRCDRQLPFQNRWTGNRLSGRAHLAAYSRGGCFHFSKVHQEALTHCHEQQSNNPDYANNYRVFVYFMLWGFSLFLTPHLRLFCCGVSNSAGFGFCAAIAALCIGFEGWLFGGFIFDGPPSMSCSAAFFVPKFTSLLMPSFIPAFACLSALL